MCKKFLVPRDSALLISWDGLFTGRQTMAELLIFPGLFGWVFISTGEILFLATVSLYFFLGDVPRFAWAKEHPEIASGHRISGAWSTWICPAQYLHVLWYFSIIFPSFSHFPRFMFLSGFLSLNFPIFSQCIAYHCSFRTVFPTTHQG